MKYRQLFAQADELITELTLLSNKAEILINQMRRLKSELWQRNYNKANNEVKGEANAGKKILRKEKENE